MVAEGLTAYLPHLAAVLDVAVSLVASGHAVLHKRDVRSALLWVGLIWLAPLLGTLLYIWLGINRIERRARALRAGPHRPETDQADACTAALIDAKLGKNGEHFKALIRLVDEVTHRPLLRGNSVTPLRNGDEAYPAMLDAIHAAERCVTLCTYIFDNDRAGALFIDALAAAVERGVEVRVIVDDVGARYSRPSISSRLAQVGVPHARFLPPNRPWRLPYFNLRTHRKILVVDGHIGFTGGANIREGHLLAYGTRHPVQDLHFRVEGPVVTQLQEVFAEDWAFCSGELLQGEPWFTTLEPVGEVLARGLADGPDEDFETFHLSLLGALAEARESVLICTPYFIPDVALITALNVAALRGIKVEIVLPEQSNLPFVQWAAMAQVGQVIERGCRVWLSPHPFDHTKIFVVDGMATMVGSGNWDARSLRLNFEFNLETYDTALAGVLSGIAQEKISRSRVLTVEELQQSSLAVRLRNGLARLLAPYL